MIKTDRLVLEPLRVQHADEMVDVLADPTLYEFTGGEPPGLAELRERYQWQVRGRSPDGSEEWLNWIIRLTADGRVIGFVQATIVDGHADVAWVVGVAWHGHGYATEAARAMIDSLSANGVQAVTAHIHADHAASAAVASRLGLVPTNEIEDGEIVWRESEPNSG